PALTLLFYQPLRPPTLTLLPYPTPFRSAAAAYPGGAITLWEGAPEAFRNSNAGGETLDRIVNAADGTGQREAMQAIVRSLPPGRDRKSTRLNSSHVKISYAVFCLKKKTE